MNNDNSKVVERAYYRERAAREEAESLLEDKTRELYLLSQQLEQQNTELIKSETALKFTLKKLEAAQEELTKLAHYDILTDLPNRLQFELDLKRELARAARHTRSFALLCLDLDLFKNVNDQYGHDAGDMVLQEAARRLKSCIREEDSIARLGGDEFAIILTEIRNINHATIIAEQIISAFSKPFYIKNNSAIVGVSIGIASYPHSGLNEKTMHKNADIALYSAKSCGRNNFQIFNTSLEEKYLQQIELNTALRYALERNEFFLVYHPRINLKDNTIVSIEALLRWNHPQHGIILPVEFVTVAEESGLIVPIGEWVLENACQQFVYWKKNNKHFNSTLSINISPRQFQNKNFITAVKRILHEYNIPPHFLEFEITEANITNYLNKVKDTLIELNNIGISFSIDDFGTGYSLLSKLKRLPIKTIKIEQPSNESKEIKSTDNAIIKSTLELARELNINIIAEGVETEEQLNFLTKSHCTQAQGYYYTKPLLADDMTNFIIKNLEELEHQ